jgi:hypothetical protein
MTVHRNRFLVNKTNRCTEFQFYWYYYSTCFGQPLCPSSGVLSRTSAVVHFMQLWWPFATKSRMERSFIRSILLLVANGNHNCIKCTKADVRPRTPDFWVERLPETCRVVIPIKLEFSASVGFIHKERYSSLNIFYYRVFKNKQAVLEGPLPYTRIFLLLPEVLLLWNPFFVTILQ